MISIDLPDTTKEICRVCFESYPSLISPCTCKGSLKYTHEECLKMWLLSKFPDISESRCEICKKKFNLTIKYKRVFTPCNSIYEKIFLCIILIFMLFFIALMAFLFASMVFKLIKIIQENRGNILSAVNFLGITALCLTAAIYSIYKMIEEDCYTMKVTEWRVLGDVSETQERSEEECSRTSLEPHSSLSENNT